jgi:hypothetical protein
MIPLWGAFHHTLLYYFTQEACRYDWNMDPETWVPQQVGVLVRIALFQPHPNTDGRRAYNVVFGLFQAPYYAFSQTMMAELTPPGFDNMVHPVVPLRHVPALTPIAVLRAVWALEPRQLDDRAECDPSDHRLVWK